MTDFDTSNSPFHKMLQRAGKVHSRHRGLMFFLRGGLVLIVVVPALLIADVLFHFSDGIRLGSVLGLTIAGFATIGISVWISIFFRAPILRLARLLESRNPALGSKLVNILQLDAEASCQDSDPLTRSLAKHAIREAGEKLDLPALPPLASEPRLKRSIATLATTTLAILLVSIFGGKHTRNEWMRFLDPFGDHPPFSLTRLEIISPVPDHKVMYGNGYTVEVETKGHQPKELFLTAVSEEGTITIPMSARGDGTFLARLDNITSTLTLTAHTAKNSARSHRCVLGLILTPRLDRTTVTLTPPAYTGLPSREIPYRFSALQALEGTGITFQIESNRPLGSGNLALDTGSGNPLTFPLAPGSTSPKTALAELTAQNSGRMTFHVTDIDGNAATETPASLLTVTRDQPPAIAITVPDEDALVVDRLTVPLTVDATDDYGLTTIRLHVAVNGEFIPLDPTLFAETATRRHRVEHVLDFAKIGAGPGDIVTVFAEAIDSRPDPQITRTTIRRLEVITEDEYNQRLREEADVASIAGKYEDLLNRFETQIAEQERIEAKLAELRERAKENPDDEKLLSDFSEAFADQLELNQQLGKMAEEMAEFGREDPVYDFEKGLQEKLKEQAEAIRKSVEENAKQSEEALEKGDPPPASPSEEMMAALEQAAREQKERLGGASEKAQEDVIEPLQDLAHLHELMKDFNLFKQLAEQQRELAEQTKAYENKEELSAEDRLALRDMGARQRELAPKLEELSNKLRQDAEAAGEKFPDASENANELAEAMDSANMPGLARRAAQSMLGEKPDESHAQAQNLHEEMERLLSEEGENGQQGVAKALGEALGQMPGMNPGDTLGQMMLSKRFRSLPKEGQNGEGQGGFMSSAAMEGEGKLLGGETFMDGPIAQSLTGRGPGNNRGLSGAPTASLDAADEAANDLESARRTGTPQGDTLLMEYENLADAYFRKLTTKP